MNISVLGIGYVGCVSSGCLAHKNNNVVAVDIDSRKVDMINSGKSPIVEKNIDNYIREGVKHKNLSATTNLKAAINSTDIAIICVGTPNTKNGQLDMSNIYNVVKEIGILLKEKNKFFTIAIRSTVMPGTNEKVSKIISENSNKVANIDFAVISNPEFLREGNAVDDFFNPPYTVVGTSSDKGVEIMKELFSFVKSPFMKVDVKVAELIKFLNNSYHALKVSFANEIGRICKDLSVDSTELMDIFIKDNILNISPKYFIPGVAYGGSCLPKDLRALNTIAHDSYINTPILRAVSKSNNEHINYIYERIINYNKKNIGIYGLTFKDGTDDLRFSSSLNICEKLIGKGYNLKIYDSNINLSQLIGQNKSYLLEHLPHIDKVLINDIDKFILDTEIILIMHNNSKITEIANKISSDMILLDVAGVKELKNYINYDGVCW